jgi:hypothetical protein
MPATKTHAKRASIFSARTRAAVFAPAPKSPASPRFAMIAMRLTTELRHMAKLGQTFSQVSYRQLGRFNRIAGATQAVDAQLSSALSDGILTPREIGSVVRKAMAANGALVARKASPRP